MLVYTVRSEFSDGDTRARYLDWLTQGHCQAVIDAGGALSAEVVSYDDGSVETRYLFPTREAFDAYQSGPAVALRAEGAEKFPNLRTMRSLGERVA